MTLNIERFNKLLKVTYLVNVGTALDPGGPHPQHTQSIIRRHCFSLVLLVIMVVLLVIIETLLFIKTWVWPLGIPASIPSP